MGEWVASDPGITPTTPQATPGPAFDAQVGAAFRESNAIVSAYTGLRNSRVFGNEPFEFDPHYSAWDEIKGNPDYQEHQGEFAGMRSPADVKALKDKIDQENRDKRLLAASGAGGFLASALAGSLDPTMLLPTRIAITAAKEGYGVARGAAEVGGAMALQSGAQEVALHASQETRTAGESVMAIGSSTILGALLGSAAAWMSPAEHASLTKALDSERGRMDAHAAGMPAPASAAATDTRDAKLVGAGGLEKLGTDPLTRTLNSPLTTARRAVSDLVENPLELEQNLRGEPSVLGGGPAVETASRVVRYTTDNAIMDMMRQQWVDLRFGGAKAPWFAEFRDRMGWLGRPAELPTWEEFDRMVGEAMTKGDTHTIPQVQATAQFIRSKVAQWSDRAEQSIEGFKKTEPLEGEGYFPHDWNREKIRANRPEFVNKILGWLDADQRTKQDIQTRIGALNTSLESRSDTIKKLSGQIERRRSALEEAEARAEEVHRFNEFAYKRAAKLSEPLDAAREKIRSIEKTIAPHLERLERLAEDIKAEKEKFPEIKQADALIFKMIGAAQKLKQSKELIDAVDAAAEYVEHLDPVIAGFKGGIRDASAHAKLARRDLGADTLVSLENTKAELKKEIKPYLKALNATRKELKEESARRVPGARGGAVFETKIRQRGNTLADELSGKRAELEELETKLQNEHLHVADLRKRIEDELGKWHGHSSAEAKSALKARAKYQTEREAKAAAEGKAKPAERLTSADDAVDAAVKRILESDKSKDARELRDEANATVDHILGTPDGRIYQEGANPGFGPQFHTSDLRGSEQRRTINVSNAEAWDWINQDAQRVWRKYLNTMVPDVLLSERFYDVAMKEPIEKILDEHAALSDATKDAETRINLDKAKDTAIRDISAMRDRLRGLYNLPANDTAKFIGRVSAAVRNLNVPMSMGMSAVSSLGDAAGVMMRWGMMSAFRDGFAPYVTSLMSGREFARAQLHEFKAAGIAIDTQFAARHHELSGITDAYQNGSPFERALQYGADKFQLVNMLGPWTDRIKAISSTVASVNLLKAVEARMAGKASEKQLRALGASNIPAAMDERIAKAYRDSGNEVSGVLLPNLGEWKDKAAAEAFNGAIAREANIMVVTPGIDKPLLMSDPMVAMLTQFKSYTAAAHTRILLANLQRRDADALGGLVGALGLGMLSYKINALTGGQPTSDNPADWIKEGMSRGNLLGWLEEGNAFAAKMTRGQLDAYRLTGSQHMLSKYAGRSALDQILGPTAGKIERLATVTGAAASMDWKASDTHALRQLFFTQNLIYLRQLFDQVEHGVNRGLGVQEKAN